MDAANWITSLSSPVLFLVVLVIGILAAELGAWLARKRKKKGIEEPESSLGTAVGAILGLLAFMLGFTFSITSSRYADRKTLLVKQANAIGTAYLRTSLIPEKQKTEIRKLFHGYTDILLGIKNTSNVDKDLAKLDQLHVQLWNQTASLVGENMDSEVRSLFTSSINDVIDLASERQTVALIFRISGVLWTSLIVLFAISMFAIGYQTGTVTRYRILDIPLVAASFAMVIVLIADMDAPASRNFEISQQPMESLRALMQQDIR